MIKMRKKIREIKRRKRRKTKRIRKRRRINIGANNRIKMMSSRTSRRTRIKMMINRERRKNTRVRNAIKRNVKLLKGFSNLITIRIRGMSAPSRCCKKRAGQLRIPKIRVGAVVIESSEI